MFPWPSAKLRRLGSQARGAGATLDRQRLHSPTPRLIAEGSSIARHGGARAPRARLPAARARRSARRLPERGKDLYAISRHTARRAATAGRLEAAPARFAYASLGNELPPGKPARRPAVALGIREASRHPHPGRGGVCRPHQRLQLPRGTAREVAPTFRRHASSPSRAGDELLTEALVRLMVSRTAPAAAALVTADRASRPPRRQDVVTFTVWPTLPELRATPPAGRSSRAPPGGFPYRRHPRPRRRPDERRFASSPGGRARDTVKAASNAPRPPRDRSARHLDAMASALRDRLGPASHAALEGVKMGSGVRGSAGTSPPFAQLAAVNESSSARATFAPLGDSRPTAPSSRRRSSSSAPACERRGPRRRGFRAGGTLIRRLLDEGGARRSRAGGSLSLVSPLVTHDPKVAAGRFPHCAWPPPARPTTASRPASPGHGRRCRGSARRPGAPAAARSSAASARCATTYNGRRSRGRPRC